MRSPDLADLPPPMLPPNVDLRDVEPSWEAFVDLAISTFELTRAEAQRLIDETRAIYKASRQ